MLWEAQFGDFVNGAQIIIDQFVVAGLSKWGETLAADAAAAARLRGQRARALERAARALPPVAAQENIRVANCTTAAQYFHLLRRQALDAGRAAARRDDAEGAAAAAARRPRRLADLADGSFQPVLDDAGADKERTRRLVLCSGKVYYDIVGHELRAAPTPSRSRGSSSSTRSRASRLAALVASYPSLEEVVWAQEEPQNMGAWRSIRHRLEEALPARRPAPLRRPPLAGEPERGLPDRAPARAGPDRPRDALA